jgi:iron complex outermembrane receptor protein
MNRKLLPALALSLCTFVSVHAQSDTTKKQDAVVPSLDEMSLEDLMKVPIVSASRKKEDAFDAPVSSYVVSRKEILNSGATSIPEALRLCPALIVTEMTNGNYQVDIRGLTNLAPFDNSPSSKTILVMIDNRAIYNQLQGGTYWESLPVDLNDVERIEVVAGPNSALFGPNAANGVINIITRNPQKKGVYGVANGQLDYRGSYIANGSFGGKLDDKFSILGSVNYQNRKRNNPDYYEYTDPINGPGYVSSPSDIFVLPSFQPGVPSLIPNYNTIFSNPNRALDKKGANLYMNYDASEKIKFGVSAGLQEVEAMKQIAIRGAVNTPLNDGFTRSAYVRAHANVYGLSAQMSYNGGSQGFLKGLDQYQYKFGTLDAYLDYNVNLIKDKFSLKPAVSYQSAFINDLPYTKEIGKIGIFNNNATMTNLAGSLRAEAAPIEAIRLIAAIRADNFTYPKNKLFISYQFVANIKPNENHNVRLVYSKSYSGSYIFNTYVDFDFVNIPPTLTSPGIVSGYRYNQNVNPSSVILYEIGYRAKITDKLNVDVALFRQEAENYSSTFNEPNQVTLGGTPPVVFPTQISSAVRPYNLDLKAIQHGVTLGVNWVTWNNKIQFKPFVTIQSTRWNNFSPYINKPAPPAFPGAPAVNNSTTQYDINSKNTPNAYGGFYFNIEPISKLNLSVSMYYFGSYQVFTNWESNPTPTATDPNPLYVYHPTVDIPSKVLLNAKISYNAFKYTKFFINVRNITGGGNSREFYGTDRIGGLYMVGVNFDLGN